MTTAATDSAILSAFAISGFVWGLYLYARKLKSDRDLLRDVLRLGVASILIQLPRILEAGRLDGFRGPLIQAFAIGFFSAVFSFAIVFVFSRILKTGGAAPP